MPKTKARTSKEAIVDLVATRSNRDFREYMQLSASFWAALKSLAGYSVVCAVNVGNVGLVPGHFTRNSIARPSFFFSFFARPSATMT
jgi:hypothetical protein